MRQLPTSTLFPYTTLFRSLAEEEHPEQAGRQRVQDGEPGLGGGQRPGFTIDRKSTRLNSSHPSTSYAVCCLKKKISQSQLHCLGLALFLSRAVKEQYGFIV